MESHVALAAEKIFSIGPIPITNTIFTTWIVTFILIIFAYMATRKISAVPQGLQNIAEVAVETFQDLVSTIAGDKTKVFLPIVGSFFFFILFGNYLGLLPGIGTVGFFENDGETFVPLFRSINSDLNTTVALALVSLIATHFLSVKYLGLGGYLGKFLSLNPIFLFVGFLEIIGEATKILSLSFRLFGNIFAGEVLLTTASTRLFAFIIPIPFYFLEMLVGFVQALIFAMLTLVFMVILTQKSH
ncbi:MAG: ATP synthase subunit a [Candidatus Curtissbacteria bacterium GW2011_GWA1_40_47]|uniref:ATP synthase subunit a n=1 Tax=Candidatus Curtissbacteria bacterium RIFOXYA1_FULL_41_14 TaxID=1797737 RepID=A0A1F5HBH2_9BACT|nr:MAG: ATP synthase subunit a [Candidatus Curtissbacteria bacterium GW2011_GWB1_40_28]KKR59170.1 MAG: ATP synthase subunit a [Candidatus Curtissbacteria bacterium GW2011_GWA2_40_31]KKR59910.1 MAG: ATP synthase subunit a [Microgenomates group bacterium GW2011_GWC1_40_35]KKR64562.1 MAG: ATP synthase subunit a [Candidatus Curtissbacteria bacterium GW2011_GWA1_40_47]KKS00181.1 MAG: ATP synthase subunit a [Candidatus Curtissbacteria bacterium GW2011_GWC2_41_21]OGD78153.1 MAG: ATP synthase F0 subun